MERREDEEKLKSNVSSLLLFHLSIRTSIGTGCSTDILVLCVTAGCVTVVCVTVICVTVGCVTVECVTVMCVTAGCVAVISDSWVCD